MPGFRHLRRALAYLWIEHSATVLRPRRSRQGRCAAEQAFLRSNKAQNQHSCHQVQSSE
jgi:hypothetical protein